MTIKFNSIPAKRLAETINASSYSFVLNNIEGWDGENLEAADFGTDLYVSFRNSTGTRFELMKIDPATIASASITILKRGLPFNGDQSTEVPANIQDVWVKGDTIVEIGSHVPQLLEETVRISGDQTVGGKKIFSTVPGTTGGNAVDATDLVPYSQALSLLTGTANVNRIVVSGTAGETLAAGNLVYLKESDGRWWKADADLASSIENIMLGIAQGSGTAGNPVSNGVLIWGLDSNQTGLTTNTIYYASNTAGGISSTVGTSEVTVGYSASTTSIIFNPRYNQQITENQQDALVGSNGSPSGSNKFVTQSGSQNSAEIYGEDAGGDDTYEVTLVPALTAYQSGQTFRFKATTANTGAATLNVNGLGAKTIKKGANRDLETGDILANQVVEVSYDGTNMQLLSTPSNPMYSVYLTTAGTGNMSNTTPVTIFTQTLPVLLKNSFVKVTIPFQQANGNTSASLSGVLTLGGTTIGTITWSSSVTGANSSGGIMIGYFKNNNSDTSKTGNFSIAASPTGIYTGNGYVGNSAYSGGATTFSKDTSTGQDLVLTMTGANTAGGSMSVDVGLIEIFQLN